MQCLSEENVHPGHKYLARRLHEAMERKRTNPFSELIIIIVLMAKSMTYIFGGVTHFLPFTIPTTTTTAKK